MTQQHPITPPPELVEQWDDEATAMLRPEYQLHLTTRAAQWGADQELEACCEWLDCNCPFFGAHHLRTERRPKPPSCVAKTNPQETPPTMPEFSTTTQALLDAVCSNTEPDYDTQHLIAAALEVLADQVVPEQLEPPCGETEPWPQGYQLMRDAQWEKCQQLRSEILAIAAEPRGEDNPSSEEPLMTEQHRAKPEVWARVESYGNKDEKDMLNCLLELRSRVEALEAATKSAESNYPEFPDSSLVKRVQKAIGHSYPDEARAAIHEVAAWLRSKTDLVYGPQCARWLEQQLDKPS